jgi:hypothetical protein
MAGLFQQKYIKPSRTITGLLNNQFRDDVLIFCNTTSGAVAITLLGIPNGNWSTEQKLYIIDSGNNATTNNITINCPSGFTINGQSSFVINSNGGSLIVRPVSNTNYIGQYSVYPPIPPVYYQTIQDEGSSLTPRQKINFTGTGVTASDDAINNATIVNISGFTGLISQTYAQITALIGSSGLVAGQTYYITDGASGDVTSGVLVQATSTNTISLTGQCLNLNADYNGVGVYTASPIPYTGTNLGIWASNLPAVAVGNVVIYDNRNFISITGVIGSAPPSDPLNWQLLTSSVTTGYILEVDEVGYNVATNSLTYRQDRRNNYVEANFIVPSNTIKSFQWGKNDCFSNTISNNSVFEATNSRMPFYSNILENSIYKASCDYSVNQGGFYLNNLSGGFEVILNQGGGTSVYGTIAKNNFVGGNKPGQLIVNNMDVNCDFIQNEVVNTQVRFDVPYVNSKIVENVFLSSDYRIFTGATNFNFTSNVVNGCQVQATNPSNTIIQTCKFFRTADFKSISGALISFKEITSEYSTFEDTLDMADPTIYDVPTKKITIPLSKAYCGRFTLLNCGGQTIEFIQFVNPYPALIRYYPNDGETVIMQHTAVASVTNYTMLCDAGASANTLIGRPIGSDYIEYRSDSKPLLAVNMRNNLVKLA